MTAASALDPIFVHASPRSGSTYFFNVLRRNETLMCFNEAIIDVFSYWGKKEIARSEQKKWDTNHSFLDRNSYSEFIEAWDSVMHLYPMFPAFQDYLPANGVLSSKLRDYLNGLIQYARSKGKRPVLCEVMSRGRAGALRQTFGGFHVAQYRDPLSQFGSFYRPLAQAGEWYFLVFPLMELGISGNHALYTVIPSAWRVPVLPWPADDSGRRWASKVEYLSIVASPRPDTIEKIFRWHLFSWFLNNLAAICYADFVFDIDKIHDDSEYRRSVSETLSSKIGTGPDFTDVMKFLRYYEFEGLDVATVCSEVVSTVTTALQDGRLSRAVRVLAIQPPSTPADKAVGLLLSKIRDSLASMSSSERQHVSVAEWARTAEQHRIIWFNSRLRSIAHRIYPIAEPIVRAARRAGIWH